MSPLFLLFVLWLPIGLEFIFGLKGEPFKMGCLLVGQVASIPVLSSKLPLPFVHFHSLVVDLVCVARLLLRL